MIESIFSDGIPLEKPSLLDLGQYVAEIVPSNDLTATDDRISMGNVGQWLNAVGDLPQILHVLLIDSNNGVKTPIRDIEIPDEDLDYIIAIYLTLRRSIKLFTETNIIEFLSQLPYFSDGNPLIYLPLLVY